MYPAGVRSGEISLLVTAYTAGDTSVCSEKFRRRERSFFISIRFFSSDGWEKLHAKRRTTRNQKSRRSSFGLVSQGGTVRKTLPTTLTPHRDYQLQENHRRLQQPGEMDLVQSSQQNSGVPKKKEAERIEFEMLQNSKTFVMWKMNFKSEFCSSSSFPAEAMVWIKEVDSARHIDQLKFSNSSLGSNIFRLRGTPNMRVLSRSCRPRVSRGESAWRSKEAQKDSRFLKGRPIASMINEYFKISGTCEALHDFNDQMKVQLKNDSVHGFHTKWDQVLLSMAKVPEGEKSDKLYTTVPVLRGIETSPSIALAGYGAQRRTAQ